MIRQNYIYLVAALAIIIATSCSKLPFSKKMRIAHAPPAKIFEMPDSTVVIDGSARRKGWWVCFSDRNNNYTQISPENDMQQKKLSFLAPLFVVKKSGDFVKVANYDAAINLREAKGKIDKKALKVIGWIRKDKLLQWSGALKDKQTSFTIKAITNVAAEDMFIHPAKYFIYDSLRLFYDPGLIEAAPVKIALGQLIYIYKISGDKKSYLIGKIAFSTADSINRSVLGWISVNAVTVWGTHSSFTYKDSLAKDVNTGLYIAKTDTAPILSLSMLKERTAFENIFPLQQNFFADRNNVHTAFLGNVLNYSNNSVLNVLGKPIAYNRYIEMQQQLSRLNVIFLVDGGKNNQLYLSSIKSALQDLQLFFDTTSYFTTTKFGAVVYSDTKCSSDTVDMAYPLTGQYSDIVSFIQQKEKNATCADENVNQPLSKALIAACGLLKEKKNEANIIVVVGTTGDDLNSINIASISSAVSRVQARLMFFQTINRSSNSYNDFMLAAEKTVISSSQDIAELKKERLVNQDDVFPNTLYSLQAGDSGIYYLDYPAKSMVQGFVIYPKKGEVMPPGMLKRNFDTLLQQVIADNKRTIQSLRTYFKSNIGINKTLLVPDFKMFGNITNPVNTAFIKQVINTPNGFFIPAFTQRRNTDSIFNYGILLSEEEYDRIQLYFTEIYKLSGAGKEKFDKDKAIKKYGHFLQAYSSDHGITKIKRKAEKLTVSEALQLFTGYISTDTLTGGLTLEQMKSSSNISKKKVLAFFNRFAYAAAAMIENKNAGWVKINCNGINYYWADKRIMP